MQSILITSKDKRAREEKAARICLDLGIGKWDLTVFDKAGFSGNDTKKQQPSIGITETKNILEGVFLKPVSGKNKALIIHDAQLMTIEAQNSMLKTLEEPPDHTYLILTAESTDALLPTIRSRCRIIELAADLKLSDHDREEFNKQADDLINIEVADALILSESLAKNKEKCLIWFNNMIYLLRDRIYLKAKENDSKKLQQYSYILKQFQDTYIILKTTNVNLRFCLEHMFLSIAKYFNNLPD